MLGFGALGEFALGETESDSGNTISPTSIDSAEAFGTHTVTADNYAIFPDAIASAEAFGSPNVELDKISPVSIDSAEAFGTASVILVISPTAIASAEAFGSPGVWELVIYKPVSKIK